MINASSGQGYRESRVNEIEHVSRFHPGCDHRPREKANRKTQPILFLVRPWHLSWSNEKDNLLSLINSKASFLRLSPSILALSPMRFSTTPGAACMYRFRAAMTILKPCESKLSNLHMSWWFAAIPHRSVPSMTGAALSRFTMQSFEYLRSVGSCSQKKNTWYRAISDAKSWVIFCSVSESCSSPISRLVSKRAIFRGTMADANFIKFLAGRAIPDPLWGVPKKRMP